ncbi:MAG TPA: DUF3365 domain-containing protein [Nitrospiraceae bacterium]|nr:DUF3365 domain-containing protein [Nitrospiraceae bacterium]
MGQKRLYIFAMAALFGVAIALTVRAAEPSFDLTARYILEVVKAFRTAYVLQIVEHAKDGGIKPREDWQKDSHFIPLPAQFVKAAADQVENFEIGLIGLTPLNKANLPKTQAETDALMKLVTNGDLRVVSFIDGEYFKAVSSDLALVPSCVECHNHHPRAMRRDFRRWDVMGGVVVRLKRNALPEGMSIPSVPPNRPLGPMERLTPPSSSQLPWVR